MSDLDELIDAEVPWSEKLQSLIDFPYKPSRARAAVGESFHDWSLQPPDSLAALASAARSGKLTIDQYREVVDGRAASS